MIRPVSFSAFVRALPAVLSGFLGFFPVPAEGGELPFDPAKISRLSLDELPRSLSVAAGGGLWLGYDLERAGLFRVWRAPEDGPAHLVTGFTTQPRGEVLFAGESGETASPWRWRRGAETVVPEVRYLGCHDGGDFFELSWELRDGEDRVILRERIPGAGATADATAGATAVRELRAEGLAAEEALLLPQGEEKHWALSSAAGAPASSSPLPGLRGPDWHRFEWTP